MPSKMNKIFIYTEGACWKRLLDADKIRKYLSANGYNIVQNSDEADKIILVTCAFLNGKSENSINRVKEFQKNNAELIVAGCLPAVEKEKLAEIFDGKTIETKNLDTDIEKIFPPTKIKFAEIEDANMLFAETDDDTFFVLIKRILKKSKFIAKTLSKVQDYVLKHLLGEKSAAYKFIKKQYHIRIAWGCTGNCSYCTIKKSTGPFRSKPFEECMKEFKKGLKEGYRNFVLDATDVGAYGIDLESSFPKLLDEMTKAQEDFYITIREINAKWVVRYVNELEEILKRNKILILDVAIQSINRRILSLMKRPQDAERMKEAFLKVRKANSDFSLTCEFIIGFPTETEEEFLENLEFIKDVGFSGGQLYEFSCRTGTEAEKIESKVPNEEIVRRIKFAKKYLKNIGYYASYIPKEHILIFMKRN